MAPERDSTKRRMPLCESPDVETREARPFTERFLTTTIQRKVAVMNMARILRKQLRIARQVRDAGMPDYGWGLSMTSLEVGRCEFFGVAPSSSWVQTRALIYVYSDAKTHAPESLELRLLDHQGREVFELGEDLSSGDIWQVSEVEHLMLALEPGNFFWLDPVESFKLAYL